MSNAEKELLIWQSGSIRFGLELHQCREVVRNIKVSGLPHAPAYIAGLVNLRGNVVTVIDLQVLLGHNCEASFNPDGAIVRVRKEGAQIAFAADQVHDALSVMDDAIEPAPANLSDLESRYVKSVLNYQGALILILNIDALNFET